MPQRASRPASSMVFGVISNPLKLSSEFLSNMVGDWQSRIRKGNVLKFVDRRYRHERIRQRIMQHLASASNSQFTKRIEFIYPESHRQYLSELAGIDTIIDSFPYSGGLTTMEASVLGASSGTKSGELFCERHTMSHLKFSNAAEYDETIHNKSGWKIFDCIPRSGGSNANKRLAHADLAEELLCIFRGLSTSERAD